MEWRSLLLLLHFLTKSVALNECAKCECCKGGASRCQNYNNGSINCQDGCIDGYFGPHCRHACLENCQTCPNEYTCHSWIVSDCDNTADSSNVGLFIGVGAGSVAVTLVAVGIFIVIRRYLRRGHMRKHKPEQAHEFTHALYDKARTAPASANIPTNTDAYYENTPVPVYEELKESNRESHTYGRIYGTSSS